MTLRVAKVLLVFAVAIFYSFVVLNNTNDYDSNYQFVRHVLMMDSTNAANRAMWRALNSPAWHRTFFVSIIVWEAVTMLLAWWGTARLLVALRHTAAGFQQANAVVGASAPSDGWLVYSGADGADRRTQIWVIPALPSDAAADNDPRFVLRLIVAPPPGRPAPSQPQPTGTFGKPAARR